MFFYDRGLTLPATIIVAGKFGGGPRQLYASRHATMSNGHGSVWLGYLHHRQFLTGSGRVT